MTSDQAFTLGVASLSIGAVLGTVAGWTAGAWLWVSVAILGVGMMIGVFGMGMLWHSWRIHTLQDLTSNGK